MLSAEGYLDLLDRFNVVETIRLLFVAIAIVRGLELGFAEFITARGSSSASSWAFAPCCARLVVTTDDLVDDRFNVLLYTFKVLCVVLHHALLDILGHLIFLEHRVPVFIVSEASSLSLQLKRLQSIVQILVVEVLQLVCAVLLLTLGLVLPQFVKTVEE